MAEMLEKFDHGEKSRGREGPGNAGVLKIWIEKGAHQCSVHISFYLQFHTLSK
jgi:hypothetical protein